MTAAPPVPASPIGARRSSAAGESSGRTRRDRGHRIAPARLGCLPRRFRARADAPAIRDLDSTALLRGRGRLAAPDGPQPVRPAVGQGAGFGHRIQALAQEAGAPRGRWDSPSPTPSRRAGTPRSSNGPPVNGRPACGRACGKVRHGPTGPGRPQAPPGPAASPGRASPSRAGWSRVHVGLVE